MSLSASVWPSSDTSVSYGAYASTHSAIVLKGDAVSLSATGAEANGIFATGQSQVSVNGAANINATVSVADGQKGKSARGVYAENGSGIVFNASADIVARSENAGTSSPDRVYAAYALDKDSTLTFNGDKTSLYASGKGNNVSYVDGIRGRKSGDISFNNRETVISAEQYSSDGKGLTAFGAVVSEGSGGNLTFNSDKLTISSRSNIRAQGLTLDGQWTGDIKKGDVIIEAIVSGNTFGTANNALGLAVYSGSNLNVGGAVKSMQISASGSGLGYPNQIQYGATGIDIGQHALVNIDAAKLDVVADSGDLNGINAEDAKPVVGIVSQDSDSVGPSFSTGKFTTTNIKATSDMTDVYGVRADAGKMFFGGETTISAFTSAPGKNATGVYVTDGATVTFNNAATVSAMNALAGNGTVTKSGTGVLKLDGQNAGFTGVFNQEGGETQLGSGDREMPPSILQAGHWLHPKSVMPRN